MTAKPSILQSVYIDPALDSFLRHQAFTQGLNTSDLLLRYIALGASVALGEEVVRELSAHPGMDVKQVASRHRKAVRDVNLAPLSVMPDRTAVVQTRIGGVVRIGGPETPRFPIRKATAPSSCPASLKERRS